MPTSDVNRHVRGARPKPPYPQRKPSVLSVLSLLQVFVVAAGALLFLGIMPAAPAAAAQAITSSVHGASDADGRLEVFGLAGRTLYHNWQNSTGWAGWGPLTPGDNCPGCSDPVVGKDNSGRLMVASYVAGVGVTYFWQLAPNGNWGAPEHAGSPPDITYGAIAIAVNADGHMELFDLVGPTDNQKTLWHAWEIGVHNDFQRPTWSTWQRLGSRSDLAGTPEVGINQDGHLDVFAYSATGLLHIFQNGSGWSDFGSMNLSKTNQPAITRNQDGRLEMFAINSTDTPWHNWQATPNGSWHGWAAMGRVPTTIANVTVAATNYDGRIEVIQPAFDGRLFHDYQTGPNANFRGYWTELPTPPTHPTVDPPAFVRNADGRMEVFLKSGPELNNVYHMWQTTPGGGWSGWSLLP